MWRNKNVIIKTDNQVAMRKYAQVNMILFYRQLGLFTRYLLFIIFM